MRHLYALSVILAACASQVSAQPAAPQSPAQTRAPQLMAQPAAPENAHGRDAAVAVNPINPVVVTGTGTHSRASETALPVKVLSGAELAASGENTLEGALLKLDPSFTTISLATMGSTFSMNGLEGKYILFLVNGRRMIGAGNDAPDLSRIDVANVRRVEVLDGASSTLYGSDAIAGVVNIITEDGRGGIDVSERTSVRSHGRLEQSVEADIKPGRLGSYTSFTHQRQGGWVLNPMEENAKGELVPTTRLASFPQRSLTVSERLTYDVSRRVGVYAQGSFYDYLQDRPLTYDGRETSYNYNMLHRNVTYGAGASYTVSQRAALFADLHSDNYTSRYEYTREADGLRPGDRQTRLKTGFTQATLKGVFNLGAHKLSAGAEWLDDRLSDYLSTSDKLASPVSNHTIAAFAQDEIAIGRHFQAIVGARYLNHEVLGSHATPTAAVMFSAGGFRARASFARGYKTPALSDIHTFFINNHGELRIGDENLRPERSNYGSVNVEYSAERLSVSATGYVNHLRDKIKSVAFDVSNAELARYRQLYGSGVTSNTVHKRTNADRARVVGLSLRAKADLGAGFMASGSYNYTDGRDFSVAAGADGRLDKTVPHSASANVQWNRGFSKLYRLGVDFGGRYTGPRYSASYSSRFGDGPAYSLWDLTTTHTFSLKSVTLTPSVGVENIFNFRDTRPFYRHYIDEAGKGKSGISPYATITPGRTFYVALSVRFRK